MKFLIYNTCEKKKFWNECILSAWCVRWSWIIMCWPLKNQLHLEMTLIISVIELASSCFKKIKIMYFETEMLYKKIKQKTIFWPFSVALNLKFIYTLEHITFLNSTFDEFCFSVRISIVQAFIMSYVGPNLVWIVTPTLFFLYFQYVNNSWCENVFWMFFNNL